MSEDAYGEYLRLHAELVALIDAGKGESEEADALRDRLDRPWYAMTAGQRGRFMGIDPDDATPAAGA